MTLQQLCEPLFQYVCRISRMARKGGAPEFADVRREIEGLLRDMKAAAGAQPELTDQYTKVEMPLVFFVDSMLADSGLPFASEWNEKRIGYEKNELAGDEKFFDLLDETLADSSDAASERLLVFYTCMGLGFTGWYAGQPEQLQRKMKAICARLRGRIGVDQDALLCPEAYEHVDARNLIEPPGRTLLGIGVALAGLIVVLFVTNLFLYRQASRSLSTSLRAIMEAERDTFTERFRKP
jgi:type IV/VI secretion system ImpK/VasF family protein